MTSGGAPFERVDPALLEAAVVTVDGEGRVRLFSEGASRLLGYSLHEVTGRAAEELLGAAFTSDESVVTLRAVSGEGREVRRLALFRDEEGGEVHVFGPVDGEGSRDQEQMLRYAKDLSAAWLGERDKARQLAQAKERLEEMVQELKLANEALARQRDELSVEVKEQQQELRLARAALHGEALEDGTVVFHGMASGHEGMLRLFHTLRLLGGSEATVLLHGESGTGKELAARALHAESRRAAGPFVALNCAAISPSLAESEFFGHVKGAFTGAIANHRGVFQQASGGTLFLDEVAELPLELQSKLLRTIQERTVTPVGGAQPIGVDVRLVAASHRSLPEEVRAGRFREDLMYRLRVVPVDIPPLRERKGDLPRLIRYLMERFNEALGTSVKSVSPEAARRLLEHSWPGNVRELQNALEHAFAMKEGDELGLRQLPPDLQRAKADSPQGAPPSLAPPEGRSWTEAEEKEAIERAIIDADGRIAEAAKRLGMSRTTFHRRRKKHRI